MTRPNEELMRHYGTDVDFQEKEAGISPFAQRLLFAMLAMRMAQHVGGEMSEQRQQAIAMNDAFRALQLQQMASTIGNAQHAQAPVFAPPGADLGYLPYPVPIGMDAGMVRVASALGAELAQMEKEAGIMSGMAGLLSKSPNLAKPFQQVGHALQAPVRAAQAAAASPMGQKIVGGLQKARDVAAPVAQKAVAGAKTVGRGALAGGLVGAGLLGGTAYLASKPVLGYLSREQGPADWGETTYGAPQLAHGINQYGQPQLGTPFIR